ncbi:MAG: hypothetical protein ABR569_08965 [Gaiellaceae bacterium]
MSAVTADTMGRVDAVRRSPYQGLVPYGESDAEWFFGRDEWCEVIGDNLRAYRITVLYGASGVGKSSVLRAGLMRRLVDEAREDVALRAAPRLLPVVFSAWSGGDPVAALRDAVTASAGAIAADLVRDRPEGSLGDALGAWSAQIDGPLLVVLDQLEELFVYHDRPDGSALEQIGDALRRREGRIHWLLSIREDALANLDRFDGYVPGLLDHLLRLEHLDRDAAREAIVAPLQRWNRVAAVPGEEIEPEPQLVEAVLDQVTAGKVSLATTAAGSPTSAGTGVEAPYLQLVLSRLWEEEHRRSGAAAQLLRLQTLEQLGGAERIVRTHLDSTMGTLPLADRDGAAAVFHYLVTPSGTKIAHRLPDLAEYGALPEARVSEVLNRLSAGDVRILRPLGEDKYEIYHDVLAAPILDWRARHIRAQVHAVRERKRRLLRRVLVGVGILALAGIASFLALWRLQADKTSDVQRKLQIAQAQSAPDVVAVLAGHTDVVYSARFSRDGTHVVTASADKTARIWNVRHPSRAPVVLRAGKPLIAASFSPDGKFVVTAGTDDGMVRVWDWRTRRVLADLQANGTGLDDVAFSPDGTRVVTAGDDGLARIWAWRAGKLVANLEVDGVVRSASFSPDGKLLATASDDGGARVWDWKAKNIVTVFRASKIGTAYDAAFDASGERLVTAGQDGSARIWSLRTRRRLALLGGHADGGLRTADFSPDGGLIVTNGRAGNPEVWNWRARLLSTLEQPGSAESAAFSPDGRMVVAPSYESLVLLFHVPRSISRSTLCRRSGRPTADCP